jgi:exosome complex component MTR3
MRRDGRYPEQLRPYVITPGVVTRAPGSVYVEVGNTKMVCSVYGPRSAGSRTATKSFQTLGNVSCEINYAPFSGPQRCPHPPETEEEDLALLLLQAICPAIRRDQFPNSYLDIFVTVLERDGSILPTAITAASFALHHCGIEMLDTVLACTAVYSGVWIMDPTAPEEAGARVTVCMLPNIGQVTQIWVTGKVPCDQLTEALALCADATRALYDNMIKPVLEAL